MRCGKTEDMSLVEAVVVANRLEGTVAYAVKCSQLAAT